MTRHSLAVGLAALSAVACAGGGETARSKAPDATTDAASSSPALAPGEAILAVLAAASGIGRPASVAASP
jgi:hypothetical protein